jgi:subtilisin family serine protease
LVSGARPHSFEGFSSQNRKTFVCSSLFFLVRRCNSPRGRVPAALLATAALAIGLPALALGDDATDPSAEGAPDPLSLVTNETAVEFAPGQLVVGLEDDATKAEIKTAVEDAGATVEQSIEAIDTKVLQVPTGQVEEAMDSLDDSAAIEYVEREVVLEATDTVPNDTLWQEQWGPKRVRAPRAWDATKGLSSIVVAVVDTGVDYGHPDLQGLFVPGYDFVNKDADPRDDQGHGTAVAGVIAARTQNHEGQAGMCWKCSVMPVKVLDRSGSGPTSTIAAGIIWAVSHGARVINLSLGGAGTTQALQDAVVYAASQGVVVVAAAGNSGSSTKFYPAAYADALSVAATTSSDNLYDWSNRGRDWVQVAAPGCNVAPVRGGGYGDFCGTSSATPIVSGIAALALSLEPGLRKDLLERALRRTARHGIGGVEYGRVNALYTLAALGLTAPVNTVRPRIVGTARSGGNLEARSGRWLGASSFAYRWQRCNPRALSCTTIPGATSQTYRLRRLDVGSTVRLLVRAKNSRGATAAFSKVSEVVERRAGAAPAGAAGVPTSGEGSGSTSGPPPSAAGSGGTGAPPSPLEALPPEVGNAVAEVTEMADGAVPASP